MNFKKISLTLLGLSLLAGMAPICAVTTKEQPQEKNLFVIGARLATQAKNRLANYINTHPRAMPTMLGLSAAACISSGAAAHYLPVGDTIKTKLLDTAYVTGLFSVIGSALWAVSSKYTS